MRYYTNFWLMEAGNGSNFLSSVWIMVNRQGQTSHSHGL
jgi:hypothetical protein